MSEPTETTPTELDQLRRQVALLSEKVGLGVLPSRAAPPSDMHKPWSGTVGDSGVAPNDRERELALRVMNKHNRGDCSTAVLMTSIAKALATYRVELGHKEADHG
jgi:hypothetical protein